MEREEHLRRRLAVAAAAVATYPQQSRRTQRVSVTKSARARERESAREREKRGAEKRIHAERHT